MGRLIRIGDALSQLLNVLLFDGNPNESLSGRAYRTGSQWMAVIDALLWLDREHCKNSYLNDVRYAGQLLNLHGKRS